MTTTERQTILDTLTALWRKWLTYDGDDSHLGYGAELTGAERIVAALHGAAVAADLSGRARALAETHVIVNTCGYCHGTGRAYGTDDLGCPRCGAVAQEEEATR